SGELSESLRHQSGLKPHLAFSHLTLQLSLRHQSRHGVNHNDVDRSRTDQVLGNLQRLLPVVRLGDQQVFGVNTEFFGVAFVKSMFRIDERSQATGLLSFGYAVQGKSGLT